jgi:hypothetical protein
MHDNFLPEFGWYWGGIKASSDILIIGRPKEMKSLIEYINERFLQEQNVFWIRNLDALDVLKLLHNCTIVFNAYGTKPIPSEILQRQLFTGRRYAVNTIVPVQLIRHICPAVRSQFNFVFVFKPRTEQEEQRIRASFEGAEFHDNTVSVFDARQNRWFFFNKM